MGIKKRFKGVMVTQPVEELPEGKTHPDFIRNPIALTIQEGLLLLLLQIFWMITIQFFIFCGIGLFGQKTFIKKF